MKLKEIAENHGLTPDGVDYALTQYQIVICEITHGMMSKLSYDAKDIIRTAQERWCDTCDLKEQKPIIRCKDCKYWRPLFEPDGYCDCDDMWRSLEGETTEVEYIRTDENFYCGYAEKEEGGERG